MKIRNGFVSNSSSSSFIVFLPQGRDTLNDMDAVKEYFMNEWGYDPEDLESVIDEVKDELNEGFTNGEACVILSAEYGCEGVLEDLVRKLGTRMIPME